ncbi:DUF6541 family protein [Microbacterium sp. YY-01]|uniref:DUF6541 family protein n=1 Tax=Microbacterium sp. YY-01 TaxID=3421634 RepID=UPI003D1820AF
MNGWLPALPALLIAAFLVVVPGLPAAFLLPLRGIARLGAAMALSLASIVVASVIAPMLGLQWSVLVVLAVAAVVTIIAAVIRTRWRGSTVVFAPSAGGAWVAAAVVAAAVGWSIILTAGIASPQHPSQLYDGIYHLNAVEFILQNGDASPLHMTMATPRRASTFYPNLWHALTSLVAMISPYSIVVSTNAVTVVVVALIWPVALAVLARALFPGTAVAAVAAPLLSFCFAVYPLGFLNWGVLYPNLLGVALSPILIACVVWVTRPALVTSVRIALLLLTLAAAGAVAIAHPSALIGALALLIPAFGAALWRYWGTSTSRSHRVRVASVVIVATAALLFVWVRANVSTHEWMPGATLAQAMGEAAFLSPLGRSTGLLLGPLAVIGAVRLIRQRRWWPVVSHVIAVFLFLMATWFTILPIRTFFVGIWYDDTTRVAALMVIMGIPLAAYGADAVVGWLRSIRKQGRSALAAALTVLLVAAGATHLLAVKNDVRMMRNTSFVFSEESRGLSPDELAVITEASRLIGPDSVVLGDPLTGAGLLYAYAGHSVVFPHISGSYGPYATLLAEEFRDGGREVCEAIDELGVDFALDFGSRSLYPKIDAMYAGLHDLDESPMVTEVLRVGDAALFEVTGCDLE